MQKKREHVKIFTAFCDDTRIKILDMLKNGEQSAATLLLHVEVAQSTLSHHMKILEESGIVIARKAGKWTYYSICETGRQYALDLLKRLTSLPIELIDAKSSI